MNELKTGSQEQPTSAAPGGHIARRRLLRAGMAAAPLMLAVSGRSAMATNTGTPMGLSPMAWNSVAPNGTFVAVSHTVGTNPLGKSPGFWTPNTNGKAATFQAPKWPVAPFDEVKSLNSEGKRKDKKWNGGSDYLFFRGVDAKDEGFAKGVKFNSVFTGGDARSFSRILLDESASGNVLWHFSAAYLNVMAYPGAYAITLKELKDLYATGKLVPGGKTLTASEIKSFLDQTWG